MGWFRLIRYEVNRQLHNHLVQAIFLIQFIVILYEMVTYKGINANTTYLLIPAQKGAFTGVILFSILTLHTLHQEKKNMTSSLIESILSPEKICLIKSMGLIIVSLLMTILYMIFAFGFCKTKMGDFFQIRILMDCYGYIYEGAILISILISSGIYFITKRFEVSLVIMGGFIAADNSLSQINYMLAWIKTNTYNLSDLILSRFEIYQIQYNRFIWLMGSIGIFFGGLAFIRSYGKKIKVISGFLGAFVLSGTIFAYMNEPYLDSSPAKVYHYSDSAAGITVSSDDFEEEPDSTGIEIVNHSVDIKIKNKQLEGTYHVLVTNKTSSKKKMTFDLNPGYHIDEIISDGNNTKFYTNYKNEDNRIRYELKIPANATVDYDIRYSGMTENRKEFGTVHHGITEDYIDLAFNEVMPTIYYDKGSALITNLKLNSKLKILYTNGIVELEKKGKKYNTWKLTSDYGLLNFYAADYGIEKFNVGDRKFELYYLAKHKEAIKSLDAVELIKKVFIYFTSTYGDLLESDEPFIVLELPQHYNGGFAFHNFFAFSENAFSNFNKTSINSINPEGGSGIDTLVHEIAHQWWGSSCQIEDSISPWSSEGLTCYSTYCFMKNYMGEDYAKKNYVNQWKLANNHLQKSFYTQHPNYLHKLPEYYRNQLSMEFSSSTLYAAMPMKLLKAESIVGGEDKFNQILSTIYKKYSSSQEQLTYEDFLKTVGLKEEELSFE